MVFLARDCLPQDSQQFPHIHGHYPQIQYREVCVAVNIYGVCVSIVQRVLTGVWVCAVGGRV